MRIQNTSMPLYNPTTNRAKSNTGASVPPDFQRCFDNYYNSLREPDGLLSNPMANAPQSVLDAWEKAKQETGEDGLGAAPDGRLTHISGYVLARLEQRFQTGNGDMFGGSVDSALSGAQKILDRLNHPLSPPSSAEVASLQAKEKLFYQKFIDHLSNIQDSPKAEATSPAAIYQQMTGRVTV